MVGAGCANKVICMAMQCMQLLQTAIARQQEGACDSAAQCNHAISLEEGLHHTDACCHRIANACSHQVDVLDKATK